MKKMLVAAIAVMLVACGGGQGGGAGDKALHLTVLSDPKTFNIITSRDATSSDIMGFVYESLIRTNGKTYAVEPNLADTWSVSPDGTTWTFHLRRDVVWSDGAPLTAADVLFTYNQLIYNPNVACGIRDILQVDGKPFVVTKIDDYSVSFFTHKPFAPSLREIGGAPILPEHKYGAIKDFNQALGINTPVQDIVGTGPFLISEFTPGQRIVLSANKRYWMKDADGKPLPRLEKLMVHVVPDNDADAEWFKSGRTDFLGIRGTDWPVLAPNASSGGYTMRNLGPRFMSNFLFFNQNMAGKVPDAKKAWFRDRTFREAVACAIDRKTIINGIYNSLAFEGASPVAEANTIFFDSGVAHYAFDLDRAASLLQEAGYRKNADGKLVDKSGNKVAFEIITNAQNNERVKVANVIAESLRRLGMDVNVNAMDFNKLVDRLDNDLDWEACILGLTEGLDPHTGANVWRVDGDLHMFNQKPRKPPEDAPAKAFQDYRAAVAKWKQGVQPWETELEGIINDGAETIDPAARWQVYSRFQRIVTRELPFIYTVVPAALYATRDRIHGFDPTPLGSTTIGAVLHNVEQLSLD